MEEKTVLQARGSQKYVDPEKILSAIEKIDGAIQITSDVSVVLDNVIHEVMKIFKSDRAWLFYPCNPKLSSFEIAFESSTPSYPGAKALTEMVPMTGDMADYCNQALSKIDEPVVDPSEGRAITNDIAIQFHVKSLMFMALQPQIGDAWMFGLHQCDHNRVWNEDDKQLFKMIGRRITNCIGNMLYFKELKESEKKYRSVVETVNEGVILQSASGEILTWNKGAQDVFGISSKDAISKTSEGEDWLTIKGDGSKYDGKDHPSMKTLRTGKPCLNELMGVYQPSGELRWISVNTNPLFSTNSDKPYAVAISFSDITNFKKVERALKESEEKYRLFADNARDVIWIRDTNLKLTYVSPSVETVRGFTPEEAKAQNLNEVLTPPSARLASKAFAQIFQDLNSGNNLPAEYTIDLEHICKNGGTIWMECKISPLKNDEGLVVGILGVSRDITERKQWEKNIWETTERFKKVFNSQLDAILILNAEFPARILECNPASVSIFGYGPDELIGETIEKLHVNASKRKAFQDKLYPLIESEGYLSNFEFSMKRKDGTVFPTEHTVFELQNDAGERTGWVSIIRDLTERRQLENRLRQARKMEAIGNLAGGIAHEFNNVLGIILGNAELALDDVPDWNPAKESLKEIRTASFRAKEVVRQILSFARKTMTSLKPLEINTIIRESLKLMRASIPAMIEIQQEIPSEPLMVLGDPTEMHQIVINLCTNAAHAMKEKGGKLEVCVSEVSLDSSTAIQYEEIDPGDYIKLTARDSGRGMEADVLEKAFEPYFTTKPFGEGTGMGLAVVYGLVKKCKGAIDIRSTIGEGTTVEILFPKIEEKFNMGGETREVLPTGTERILLVDDDESIVRMVGQMLKRLGYSVKGMSDSMAALECFESTPDEFDMVITDMAMPHMSGDQLAAELMKVRKDIPILLCTGHSDTVDEKRARQMGIKGFVMKPLDKGTLAKAVRNTLVRTH